MSKPATFHELQAIAGHFTSRDASQILANAEVYLPQAMDPAAGRIALALRPGSHGGRYVVVRLFCSALPPSRRASASSWVRTPPSMKASI